MEQTLYQRNSPRNMSGTYSLKALANKGLDQNTKGNKPGTGASKPVPPPDQPVPLRGTKSRSDNATRFNALSYDIKPLCFMFHVLGCETVKHF